MDADEMRVLVCTGFFKTSGKYTLLFAAISFFLFIATVLGNTLILVALRKESSLHPPSKLLYSCLAITDLLVGLIVGPAAAVHYMNWTINLGRESETDGSNKETKKVLKSLLRNELKIPKDAVDHLEFERVHRIPTRRNTLTDQADANKPRPIIAKMSFFKDKGRIFQHVKNINPALKIGVADDFPKEIEDMRKELLPVLKKAKKQNKRASFNVDKLIIDGHIYRGPETKKLPLYANILST
ncbi:hypothetical protein ACROYT_G033527 [Oculina patagonica]